MILQSLWFVRPGPAETKWLLVATLDFVFGANNEMQDLIEQFTQFNLLAEGWMASLAALDIHAEKRQEWNTPPRVITAAMQPNVP